MELLEENGVCYDCDDLTVDCYSKLLEAIGYNGVDSEGKSVAELATEFPDDILLVRLDGHLTCVINGCCYDIWDCTEQKSDRYWII